MNCPKQWEEKKKTVMKMSYSPHKKVSKRTLACLMEINPWFKRNEPYLGADSPTDIVQDI